ncbi:hypothetical protein FE257_008849 [Aspergillus nanangensis]|uniref:Ferulic acid decarboxylase 1 n=1 Tax=Aspergillus nanangensis TaxID=2582783 RepID=A0AAD4CKM9_ASPNN|nr:hypothetical protein FE257_008849 [Aspergillus nanangensis]
MRAVGRSTLGPQTRLTSSKAYSHDFRSFLDALRQQEDLLEIHQEVDPILEAGAIVRRTSEINGRAPLFHNIKGARDGLWRMFGNAASLRSTPGAQYGRIATALGLPQGASWKTICDFVEEASRRRPVAPEIVSDGPCKENKMFGGEIDLNQLPVPQLHMEDGGKYLQTYGLHVLQSPEASWTNWSIFRGMVHDARHLACLVGTGQHNSVIRERWRREGKTEIPWALALGVPPAASIVAALPIPHDISEAEYVGAMLGRPLKLVKCELSDLLVPATSEIVLEGTFSFTETGDEGLFGDYLGVVFDGDRHQQPLFRVDAITYRNDAILPVSVPGRITDESHTTAALAAAQVMTLCKKHNLPVTDAFAPFETMATWCALQIDIKELAKRNVTAADFCQAVGELLFRDKSCMLINRILLVGDDIDVYDFKDVIWALVTRCRPGQDEYVFEDVPGFFLTPYMSHGGGDRKMGGKSIFDCLLPMEYQGRRTFRSVDFERSYPEDVKARVQERYGLSPGIAGLALRNGHRYAFRVYSWPSAVPMDAV